MKLAYLIFESPWGESYGGIGTYVLHMLPAMAALGHQVHLFCGPMASSRISGDHPFVTHEITNSSLWDFPEKLLSSFLEEHGKSPFDCVEGTDFGASAYFIQQYFPELPVVLTLHTPGFVLNSLNESNQPGRPTEVSCSYLFQKIINRFRNHPPSNDDMELESIRQASLIFAPTKVIGDIVRHKSKIPHKRIECVPLPFRPDSGSLNAPIARITNRLCFVGRLCERKGILELVQALKSTLLKLPFLHVVFVGRDLHLNSVDMSASEYIHRELADFLPRISLLGELPRNDVLRTIASSDIAIFPSRFESFGYVCLEAMAAGTGIIVSAGTGLAEILGAPECGIVVPQGDVQALVDSIVSLATNPKLRQQMGTLARLRVTHEFEPQRIAELRYAKILKTTR